ncbi:hypothetical protein Droror1_Dr00008531 [Drosera rotundifolia]
MGHIHVAVIRLSWSGYTPSQEEVHGSYEKIGRGCTPSRSSTSDESCSDSQWGDGGSWLYTFVGGGRWVVAVLPRVAPWEIDCAQEMGHAVAVMG